MIWEWKARAFDPLLKRTLPSTSLLVAVTQQYSFLVSRWRTLFSFFCFLLTEACLLTHDLWKCFGVSLPNPSSCTPLLQDLTPPLPTLPQPQHPSEHPFHLCHLLHHPHPPSPSRRQSHWGGSSNKLPGTALLKWGKSKREGGVESVAPWTPCREQPLWWIWN